MTGKELIELIKTKKAENLPICVFSDFGAVQLSIDDVDTFKGEYKGSLTPKMVYTHESGAYLGFGNPGDFESTQQISDCERIDLSDLEPEVVIIPVPIMTVEEIIQDLLSKMDDAARKTWLDVEKSQLVHGHHSTGRSIRNTYRLWEENHPACIDKHPDDVSMEIMEAIWDKLHS